jgi:hypothetical protein
MKLTLSLIYPAGLLMIQWNCFDRSRVHFFRTFQYSFQEYLNSRAPPPCLTQEFVASHLSSVHKSTAPARPLHRISAQVNLLQLHSLLIVSHWIFRKNNLLEEWLANMMLVARWVHTIELSYFVFIWIQYLGGSWFTIIALMYSREHNACIIVVSYQPGATKNGLMICWIKLFNWHWKY